MLFTITICQFLVVYRITLSRLRLFINFSSAISIISKTNVSSIIQFVPVLNVRILQTFIKVKEITYIPVNFPATKVKSSKKGEKHPKQLIISTISRLIHNQKSQKAFKAGTIYVFAVQVLKLTKLSVILFSLAFETFWSQSSHKPQI